jgi:hypothetical protein
MGQAMDIFPLSGMKYPSYILAPTFSTVSLDIDTTAIAANESLTSADQTDKNTGKQINALLRPHSLCLFPLPSQD